MHRGFGRHGPTRRRRRADETVVFLALVAGIVLICGAGFGAAFLLAR